MTKKEAIDILHKIAMNTPVDCTVIIESEKFYEAFDFAIKALMAYRDCRHCTHNIKIGNMRGCELGDCDFEDKRGGVE